MKTNNEQSLGSPGPLGLKFWRSMSEKCTSHPGIDFVGAPTFLSFCLRRNIAGTVYCAWIFVICTFESSDDDPFICLFSQINSMNIIESHVFQWFYPMTLFFSMTNPFVIPWVMADSLPSSPRIIDIAWKEHVSSGKDAGATNGGNMYLFVSHALEYMERTGYMDSYWKRWI